MRFDRRFFIVLSVSLLWAFVVSAMFYRMAARPKERPPEPRRQVVVANRRLAIGAILARDAVELREVPESYFPAGGISRVEDVLDRPVISPIQPGEPIAEARLAPRGSGMGLAPLIPPGMRAISVRVNDVVGVSGFILPGMHVDVLVTGRSDGINDTVTRTVLQNIGVLSAGQTLQNDGKSQSIQVPVVTLLVTPHDAEALTLAISEGKVQLALRNSADVETAPTVGSRLHELYAGVYGGPMMVPPPRIAPVRPASSAPAIPAASPTIEPKRLPAAKPAADEVEVIHGKQKSVEVFVPKGSGE